MKKWKLRKYFKEVKLIRHLNDFYKKMTDEELKILIKEIQQKQDFERNEVFAIGIEAIKRTLGYDIYDVQLVGGLVLDDGCIAEMKTGEGKTLVATLPAVYNALKGLKVHIVTVNDYLAHRDYEWMKPIYEFFGLTVGYVINSMSLEERKSMYQKDIVYITNKEIGFDYLRNSLAKHIDEIVFDKLDYAIIDEIDSILIDEARTPLIISNIKPLNVDYYINIRNFVKTLHAVEKKEEYRSRLEKALNRTVEQEEGDVVVDKKNKTVYLTEQGVKKAEKYFGLENYSDPKNIDLVHHINNALYAEYILKRDIDYIVRNNKIELIDPYTGRIYEGRVYNHGLQQAVEAKENVPISHESVTLASITYQNLFKYYRKIAGMTGTAIEEKDEFETIYGLKVIQIPTNRPIIRIDHSDKIFLTKKEKYEKIIEEVEEEYKKGRPVLIGTPNIEVSEEISRLLTERGIKHELLNAKNPEREAEIIAKAGQKGAITVATNMAGRGTDIKLGEGVRELGGLKIIGVERHENRRIDNQLIGRAGRQGDPGETVFYISLEDDLIRTYTPDYYLDFVKNLKVPYGQAIQHPILDKIIRKAQKTIESMHYNARKTVYEYDLIIDKQRQVFYKDRNKILRYSVYLIIQEIIELLLRDEEHIDEDVKPFVLQFVNERYNENNLIQKIQEMLKQYDEQFIREVILSVVDTLWIEHINELELLMHEIQLQAYANKDPLIEFNRIAYNMFEMLNIRIRNEIMRAVISLVQNSSNEN